MAQRTDTDPKDLVRFRDILPGLARMILHAPSVIKHIKAATDIQDEDRKSLGWKLEENARLYPDRPAVLCEDVRMTHRELNEAVNRHAHYFLSLGLKKGDPVVVMIENRPEFLVVTGALAKIGAIASLINTNQRDQVLAYSINLTKGRIFVVGEELYDAFETVRPELGLTPESLLCFAPDRNDMPVPEGYVDLPAAIRNMPSEDPPTTGEVMIQDPICYIFTSGTTGLPKAAYLANRRWIGALYGFGKLLMDLNENDVLYCTLPLFHTTAFCVGWPTAAANGAALAIRRKFSATRFWSDAEHFKATAFVYIGELCRYLLNQPPRPEDRDNPMKKIVGNGLRPDIWLEFKKRFGIRQITELYGATEFGFAFTNFFNIDHTVGMCLTPFAIVRYDLDADRFILDENGLMQRVQRGEAGMLLAEISEKTPFVGYTDRTATEKKILKDVFEPGDVWLNTGDFVRDQGFKHIQFADRLGDTFRWKGENVSTTQVEEVISAMPQVSQAAVYGVRIPGTDGRAGMASVIPSLGLDQVDLEALTSALHEALPAYAVPKFIRFKTEFDVTPTFKVKKSILRNEGFDLEKTADPIYALLPDRETYVPLTPELFAEIEGGKFRF